MGAAPLPENLRDEEGIPEAIEALREALQSEEVRWIIETREQMPGGSTMMDWARRMREKGVSPEKVKLMTGLSASDLDRA